VPQGLRIFTAEEKSWGSVCRTCARLPWCVGCNSPSHLCRRGEDDGLPLGVPCPSSPWSDVCPGCGSPVCSGPGFCANGVG
jgi:hypothetical protein